MIRTFILMLIVLSSNAFAADQCLQRATNQDLLDEIGRRLNGPNPTTSATASYNCDNFGDMLISLVGASGTESTAKVSVRNESGCQDQADALRNTRAKINVTMLAGVCDSFGDLHRFSLTPNGTLSTLSTTTLHDQQACLQQASQMNGR